MLGTWLLMLDLTGRAESGTLHMSCGISLHTCALRYSSSAFGKAFLVTGRYPSSATKHWRNIEKFDWQIQFHMKLGISH
eukprot:m.86937 g.86937  ORF g.86937 m.86937 type:complete len:79 (+) comp13077_c0_seq1:1294-1530(+)